MSRSSQSRINNDSRSITALCRVRKSARLRLSAPPVHFFLGSRDVAFVCVLHTTRYFLAKSPRGCAPGGGHAQMMGTDTQSHNTRESLADTQCVFAFLVRAHSNGTICQKIVRIYQLWIKWVKTFIMCWLKCVKQCFVTMEFKDENYPTWGGGHLKRCIVVHNISMTRWKLCQVIDHSGQGVSK